MRWRECGRRPSSHAASWSLRTNRRAVESAGGVWSAPAASSRRRTSRRAGRSADVVPRSRAPRRRRCATERTNDCASSASGPLTEEGGVDRPPLAGGRLRRRALLLLRVVVATRGRSDAPPRAPRGHLLLPLCRRRSSSAGARGRRPEAVGDAGQGRRRGRRRRRRRPRGTNALLIRWSGGARVCVEIAADGAIEKNPASPFVCVAATHATHIVGVTPTPTPAHTITPRRQRRLTSSPPDAETTLPTTSFTPPYADNRMSTADVIYCTS